MAVTSIWLVTGDKPGDNAQLMVIAEALGLAYEVRRMIPQKEYIYGKPAFKPSLDHLDMQASDSLVAPWPDLVLTIGIRPAMAAQWIRQQSGGRTQVVLLGRPKKLLNQFALVITTGQYIMPQRDNIYSLALPLMRVDPEKVAIASRQWAAEFQNMPQPVSAVLIGGPTMPYRMDVETIALLLQQAEQQAAGGSLYISTSRRTPAAVIEYLQQHKPARSRLYCWQAGDSHNPYFALLGLAEHFVVTGDSLSMMVEIARLGKPLAIYPLPEQQGMFARLGWIASRLSKRWLPGAWVGYARDLGRIHRYLLDHKLASILGQSPVIPGAPLDDQLPQVVQRIKKLLPLVPPLQSGSPPH